MSKQTFHGLPEKYMQATEGNKVDIDALNCALSRAEGVCIHLMSNFDGEGPRYNDDIICNTLWALEGIIKQAQVILEGKKE